MNSCSDLGLNFVSGSSFVTYNVNTRIRELLRKSQLKMGGVKMLAVLYFCRAMSTVSWQVFELRLVLVQLFVTKLWWMCSLVMCHLKLCVFPL